MFIKLSEFLKPVRQLSKPRKASVISNDDPRKLGRVKCVMFGLIEETDEAKLPWVYPYSSDPDSMDVPEVGDDLIVIFPFGDIYAPAYLGQWISEITVNPLFDTNYPNTVGKDMGSLSVTYNKTIKEGNITHETGTSALLKADGTIQIALSKDITIVGQGTVTQSSTGNMTFSSDGNYTITGKGGVALSSDGNVTIAGKGGVDVSSDGVAKFSGKGSTEVGSSSSVTKVNGSVVLLAGGAKPVATLGSQCIGLGNLAVPVISTIIQGSQKVFA